MNLHKDKDTFRTIIEATSAQYPLQPFQIEKDYYVSLFLNELSKRAVNSVVFKGGTSLSKCYDVIDRFSEDIDIAIKSDHGDDVHAKERRNIRDIIIEITRDLGMELINEDSIRSRRDFNAYKIKYDNTFQSQPEMMEHIIIESIVAYPPYPCENHLVSNYITKFLNLEKEVELIDLFGLHPFTMSIQSIDRTFIDKLFAIADYHLQSDYRRHSRHLYDVHMIWRSHKINMDVIKEILPKVIRDRQLNGIRNISCKPGCEIGEVLKEIIEKNVFKSDYQDITLKFIYKNVSYVESIQSLKEIVEAAFLPKEILDYSKK